MSPRTLQWRLKSYRIDFKELVEDTLRHCRKFDYIHACSRFRVLTSHSVRVAALSEKLHSYSFLSILPFQRYSLAYVKDFVTDGHLPLLSMFSIASAICRLRSFNTSLSAATEASVEWARAGRDSRVAR